MFDFALQHPQLQPQLLIQLSGTGLDQSTFRSQSPSLHCPVLLIHGDKDEFFSVADTKQLALELQTSGVPVELKIIADISHGMEPERGVISRSIGEYCISHLSSNGRWQNYRSITQWQTEAPPFGMFCLPAAAWAVGWLAWWWFGKPARPEKIKLKRPEIALRWLAVLLATWASAETAIHLATPFFSVSDRTVSLARQFLVQPKERADFECLAAKHIWLGEKMGALLDHVELAGYNRELINWQLDDKIYRDFVLSPVITGNPGEQLGWRRPLWEEFYPRIRHESSPEDATKIVVRHLRERVTIAALQNPPQDVPNIWLKQITDEAGFEIIYVAALRSVGVSARLDASRQADFWDGTNWCVAPNPSMMSWQ